MKSKVYTEFDRQKATKKSLIEKAVLPFLKTYTINEPNCQLSYKMFNGKIFIVNESSV